MTSNRFNGKVVLVTGATGGLGTAASKSFVDEGAQVFATDVEEREIMNKLHSNATFYKCDVTSLEECENAVQACVEKFGRLDILFYNVGTVSLPDDVVDVDVKLFKKVMDVNMYGFFHMSRAVIPQMRTQGGGAIVATASTAGLRGDYGFLSYTVSKHAVVGLMRAMAMDHVGDNIRVNAVCPGTIKTPMTAGLRANEKMWNELCSRVPMGRAASPEEIVKAVLFLASEDASYMTGETLVVDGGMLAYSGYPKFSEDRQIFGL